MSNLSIIPREEKLSYDPFSMAATLSDTGYWVGKGVAYLKIASSPNPAEIILSPHNIVGRYSSIGTLVGSAIGILYPALVWCVTLMKKRAGYVSLNDDPENNRIERQKSCYRLSTSRFYTWDIRLFLTSQAFAILTTVIMMNVGSSELSFVADDVGRGIGSLIGAAIGFFIPSALGRYVADHFCNDPANEIQEQQCLNESRHDVPFWVRLFFGAWTGYIGISVLSTPKNAFGSIDLVALNFNQLMGTMAFAMLAFFSPLFFVLGRRLFNRLYTKLNPENDEPKFKFVRWYRDSRMDLPWYARLFAGVVASATVGLMIQDVQQADQIPKILVYMISSLAWIWPHISYVFEKLYDCIVPNSKQDKLSDEPQPLKLCYDMPWYARAMFSAIASSMLSDILRLIVVDPIKNSVLPPSNMPIIISIFIMTAAMLTPCLMAFAHRLGYTHEYWNPTKEDKKDLTWPWYARLPAGLWLGALIAGAFNSDQSNLINQTIGPQFLGINNAHGAPATALLFGIIGLVMPLAQQAWNQYQEKGLKETMRFFTSYSCISNEFDEENPSVQNLQA